MDLKDGTRRMDGWMRDIASLNTMRFDFDQAHFAPKKKNGRQIRSKFGQLQAGAHRAWPVTPAGEERKGVFETNVVHKSSDHRCSRMNHPADASLPVFLGPDE